MFTGRYGACRSCGQGPRLTAPPVRRPAQVRWGVPAGTTAARWPAGCRPRVKGVASAAGPPPLVPSPCSHGRQTRTMTRRRHHRRARDRFAMGRANRPGGGFLHGWSSVFHVYRSRKPKRNSFWKRFCGRRSYRGKSLYFLSTVHFFSASANANNMSSMRCRRRNFCVSCRALSLEQLPKGVSRFAELVV